MDCPKCGESMKKGCIAFGFWDRFALDHHIEWYYENSIEKYGDFFKSVLKRPDIIFKTKKYKMAEHGLDAYLCEKCGTMTVMPLPEDVENIEYYIEDPDTDTDSDTEV